jgi:hypothetical protein
LTTWRHAADDRPVRVAVLLIALHATVAVAADPTVLKAKLERPARGFQIRTTAFEVPPGEREICQAVRLPVGRAIDVDRITVRMPSSSTVVSHHFAMFLADASAPNLPLDGPVTNVGCFGTGGAIVSPILGFVQRLNGDVIRFPKGIGVTLGPENVLLFNSHYVNVGDAPVTVDVAVNFRKAKRGKIKRHARSFQLGIADIAVPAGATGSASAEWAVPFPMDVVWVSTHSHKHTTTADVEALAGGTTRPLVHTTSYAEPDFAYFTPPALRLLPGDSIRWTCNYRNATDDVVRFGVSADDEMCFAVGFFLTDDDGPLPPLPPSSFCFGNGLGLVCPAN